MSETMLIQEDSIIREANEEDVLYVTEWQKKAKASKKQMDDQVKATETARLSALTKLEALGLTPEEIAALKG
jgi:hypothetical protein